MPLHNAYLVRCCDALNRVLPSSLILPLLFKPALMRIVPRLELRLSEHRKRDTRLKPEATAAGRRNGWYEGLVLTVCYAYEGNDRLLTSLSCWQEEG